MDKVGINQPHRIILTLDLIALTSLIVFSTFTFFLFQIQSIIVKQNHMCQFRPRANSPLEYSHRAGLHLKSLQSDRRREFLQDTTAFCELTELVINPFFGGMPQASLRNGQNAFILEYVVKMF